MGFHIYKIWQILKRFAGTFRGAQTLKLGGVKYIRIFKIIMGTVPLLGIYMLMGSNGVGQDGPSTHSGIKKIVQ